MSNLIVANWKMNLSLLEARDLVVSLTSRAQEIPSTLCICPPFPYLSLIQGRLINTPFDLGAQDCSLHDNGAHTGDVSAQMLKELGCSFVIAGHSERRISHQESNAVVKGKAERIHEQGMTAIVCVGESHAQRTSGKTLENIEEQLKGSLPSHPTFENTVIAYEPVWAIGTGQVPTLEEIQETHAFIRTFLKKLSSDAGHCRILYGGSVKADNAREILSLDDVDGVLVGGASLKADTFLAIARA